MRISDWSSDVCSSDLGATQMRRYCRAAVKPLHRAAYRKFHMTVQSMRRRVTKLYAGRPPSAGKSSRAVSCHAVGSKASRNVSPGGVAGTCVNSIRSARERNSAQISAPPRSEEHTYELKSLMRISYAVFCLKKKQKQKEQT